MQKKQFIQIGLGYYPECIDLAKGAEMWGLPKDIDWTGVIVDFNPLALQSAMKAVNDHNLSDKVTVLNAAVANWAGIKEVGFNHISDEVDVHSSLVNAKTDRDVQFNHKMFCAAVPLNYLIREMMRVKYVEIGLLALDVQGSEVDILQTYHWIHVPDYIKVETHSPELDKGVRKILEPMYRVAADLTGEHDKKVGRPNLLWEKLT